MELKEIKSDTGLLELEVKGEEVGFVNLIKEELWNDKQVNEAAFIKEHPYMTEPKIYVKMKGRADPKVALRKAQKRLLVKLKDLKGEFQRALKD
jgi:DNA-directed RNA polymerase subunit L